MAEGVSLVCPVCITLCGWNEKKKTWDGVQVPHPDKTHLQYAHEACMEKVKIR